MSLELIVGCMFSGKTTELIRRYYKWFGIHKKILCINYIDDVRYKKDETQNNMYAHNGINLPSRHIRLLNEISIVDIIQHDIILINEGQFFEDILLVIEWVNIHNKHVIISALDGDYKGETFGDIYKLYPHSDSICKMKALCHYCENGTEAIYTHRLSNEQERIVIGHDNYVPLCRKHWLEKNQ